MVFWNHGWKLTKKGDERGRKQAVSAAWAESSNTHASSANPPDFPMRASQVIIPLTYQRVPPAVQSARKTFDEMPQRRILFPIKTRLSHKFGGIIGVCHGIFMAKNEGDSSSFPRGRRREKVSYFNMHPQMQQG
ncbi:Uncharacterized protein Fot_42293 [Forsythia ovata]|uniref:Uncharacterized protein n=1 Tax=Forsythia ovata TaxID=205694 RepID=A0ABD1RLH7_9LAMI